MAPALRRECDVYRSRLDGPKANMKTQQYFVGIVVALSLLAIAGTIARSAQMPESKAHEPSPRTDRNSMLAHAELLEKAKHGRIDVYFEGDSITRRWGTSDEQYKHFLENWRQNFFGWNAADFGWGADKTQNILWRLNNGELDNVKPKIIVLLAGTNNVGNHSPESKDDPRVEDITRGIKAILDVCREKAPSATIVLMGIFPRNDNISVMPIINEINRRTATFADGKKIRYLNINNKLADKDGKLFDGMTNKDGLHLDLKGYQVWADALKPIFKKLLGPPAKEDHAPPPTGDPSAEQRATITIRTADGGLVNADVYGSGPRGVVLAHGGRFDRNSWRDVAKRLVAARLRVIAIDFRAAVEARAGHETQCLYDEVCLAKDVAAAVEYLRSTGSTTVSIVGASLGGGAAAQASVESAPGTISRLVLLAHMPIAAPEKMQGRKLFIVTRNDIGSGDKPRLPEIKAQYEKAPDPKRLIVLNGSAHAQFIFETDQRERLMREIVQFLTER